MSRREARGAFLVWRVGGLGVLFADGFAFGAHYDVAPDGRFLMTKDASSSNDEDPAQVVLIQNWLDELQRLVPVP